MPELRFHLLLPLIASLLSVSGLVLVKRTNAIVNPWTVTFLANQWAAVAFSFLWCLGGTERPWTMLWQPAVIAVLYIAGQVFTFLAIDRGDVSVAMPVLGIKVMLVAVLVTWLTGSPLPRSIWTAAGLATCGIAMVQWTGPQRDRHGNVRLTIVLSILCASCFALFDVLVQRWSPSWGAGRFLPIVYWMVAVMSLVFLPRFQRAVVWRPDVRVPLLVGTCLIGLQAIFIVLALSIYGDAARVNVVYALRGLWGVAFAWGAALIWGGSEANLPRPVMMARLGGALCLTLAVAIVVLSHE